LLIFLAVNIIAQKLNLSFFMLLTQGFGNAIIRRKGGPMKYIVMVDQGDSVAEFYAESLKQILIDLSVKHGVRGCWLDTEVKFFDSVDNAWDFINEHATEVIGVITEVMMLPGRLFPNFDDTEGGMKTGLRFYEMLWQRFPLLQVIFLTYLDLDWDWLETLVDGFQCIALQKYDTPPFDFAESAIRFFRLAPEAVSAAA